jgi:hypothetical protein
MKRYLFDTPINIPPNKVGKWEIRHKVFPAGSTIDVISSREAIFNRVMGKKRKRPTTALLVSSVKFHQLLEDGGIWMSDIPQEQESHKHVVKKCKGSVLIGGLGIGYVTKMLDLKESVTSIKVIEKSKEVIELVWKHLKTTKAEIVEADLFDYLKYTKDKFDWAYYDIWAPTGEDVLFTHIRPLKTLSKGIVPIKHILCWQEEVMLGQMLLQLSCDAQMPNFGAVTLDEEQFQHAYRFQRTRWAYLNWLRSKKPDKDLALFMARAYTLTYTNVDHWNIFWKEWDYKEAKQC